jgi:hypothetical protein
MSERAERTRRVLELQVQLHRVERWKLLDLRRRAGELDAQRRELIAALNDSDPLWGLLLNATARRLKSIAQEADAVAREEALQAARVGERALRVACAERLSETVDRQAAREDEKHELLEVIDRLEQDRP